MRKEWGEDLPDDIPGRPVWSFEDERYFWVARKVEGVLQVWRFELMIQFERFLRYQKKIIRGKAAILSAQDAVVKKAITNNTWIDGDWSIWSHSNKPKRWPFKTDVRVARCRRALIH